MIKIFEKIKTRKLKLETELIEREIARSRRFKYSFGLLVLEVKNSIPRGLSRKLPGKTLSFHLLQKNLRPYDKIIDSLVRRYYILLPQTNYNDLSAVEKRIKKLAKQYKWGTINIGIAIYPDDSIKANNLIHKAIEYLDNSSISDSNGTITEKFATA